MEIITTKGMEGKGERHWKQNKFTDALFVIMVWKGISFEANKSITLPKYLIVQNQVVTKIILSTKTEWHLWTKIENSKIDSDNTRSG